jgi:hypothetical protein
MSETLYEVKRRSSDTKYFIVQEVIPEEFEEEFGETEPHTIGIPGPCFSSKHALRKARNLFKGDSSRIQLS